ncbi:hypothetical protein [Lentzea sp. NPDC060358]|uniref:hypothetical protein n=1 Tax=Lentzea sp. NPDC060358 TaxID=3347103 RepID=UPI00365DC423
MKRTATLLVAALVLTACSEPAPATSDRHTDVKSFVAAVRKAVGEKKTYRFTIAPPTAGGVTAPATGSVRLDDVPGIDATTSRPVQSGGQPQELRYVSTARDAAFVKLPAAVFGLPQDKPWVKLARADDDEFTTTLLGYHDVIYQQAVFTTYHLPVIEAGGSMQLITEVADRTKYVIAVDYRKAYDALTDEALRNELKLALDQGVAGSVAEVEMHSDDLPTRIEFSTQFQDATIVDEARFSDWGSEVTISVPGANEISPRS